MRHFILMFALAAMPLSACGGEEEPEAPVDEAPEPEVEAEAEEPEADEAAEAEPTEEELPIAEDFEEEVAAAVTTDNYGSVLDELEAELAEEAAVEE